jgi:hypothetical protein
MTLSINLGSAESTGDSLRHDLAALLETIDEMQTKSGPLLTARYQSTLGRLELQRLELQIEILATRRRIESLQSIINCGQPLTATCLSAIETRIERELADWWRQLETQEQACVEAREFLANVAFADADEARRVKAAYRQLARFLHPDASPENSDLFEKYWPSVQDAYKRVALVVGAPLGLRREPANPHDELAIEILAESGLKLGYIPRHRNPVLARLMDAGKQLLATVASIGADARYSTDELPDVRLSILLRE